MKRKKQKNTITKSFLIQQNKECLKPKNMQIYKLWTNNLKKALIFMCKCACTYKGKRHTSEM